jgi:DNA-directed RNA polymerase specialized sigma24 family protein
MSKEMVVTARTRQSVALSDPELRRALTRMVRVRAPEADVEDIVQATLVEAIASGKAPEDLEELRKWVFGIARHKVADRHRSAGRVELTEDPMEAEATSAPHGAADLMRWVEAELPSGPDAQKTLEWMAREADGDKLEAIAAEENVPAARVRQRVSRLRRLLRERWAAALIAVVVIGLAVLGLRKSRSLRSPAPIASTTPVPTPFERARALRDAALERCGAGAWKECLEKLDEARKLDPVGDEARAIQEARAAAERGLAPPVAPPSASVAPPLPSSSAPVTRPVPTTTPRKAPRYNASESWGSGGPGSSGK